MFTGMDVSLIVLVLLPLSQLFISKRSLPYSNLSFVFLLAILSSFWAVRVLQQGTPLIYRFSFPFWGSPLELLIDPLSAFFILVINFTALTGAIYAIDYLKAYPHKTRMEWALHTIAYSSLQLAMLLVTLLQNGLAFLVAWELMSVSSFLLVIFEGEKREALFAGIKYLVQMHIGVLLLLVGFILLNSGGAEMDFRSLQSYFSTHPNWPLFLIFFGGFAIKAGFVPLHTWLPHAHPAAPSHVSGVMSGVMIKREYDLLLYFMQNPKRVLTKESIAEHLWGDHIDQADSFDFIYNHIKNLRKKISSAGGKNYIQAMYSMGYKFSVDQ